MIGANSSGKSSVVKGMACADRFRRMDLGGETLFDADSTARLDLYPGELINRYESEALIEISTGDFNFGYRLQKDASEGKVGTARISSVYISCAFGQRERVFELNIPRKPAIDNSTIALAIPESLAEGMSKGRPAQIRLNNGFLACLAGVARSKGNVVLDFVGKKIKRGDSKSHLEDKSLRQAMQDVRLGLKSESHITAWDVSSSSDGGVYFDRAIHEGLWQGSLDHLLDKYDLDKSDILAGLWRLVQFAPIGVQYLGVKTRGAKGRSIKPSDQIWADLIKKEGKSYKDAWSLKARRVISQFLRSQRLGSEITVKSQPDGSLVLLVGDEYLHDLGQGHRLAIQTLIQVVSRFESDLLEKRQRRRQNRSRNKDYDITVRNGWVGYNDIIVIEEPESNLHPSAQTNFLRSLLMLLTVVQDVNPGIAIVLETHSEYIVRATQLAVKQNQIQPEAVSLQFLEKKLNRKKEGRSTRLREIKLNDVGLLESKFGRGFYDESVSIMKELFDRK